MITQNFHMKKIFDYQKITYNRDKIAQNLHTKDDLLQQRAKFLHEIITLFFPQRKFDQILEFNSYTGQLTSLLQALSNQIHCVDFSPKMLDINKKNNPNIKIYQIKDEILPPFEINFDLAIDLCGLYFINDLPLLLQQIKKLLSQNGIFIGTLLGMNTLCELKEVMIDADLQFFNGIEQRIAPFCQIQNIGMLLQNMHFKNVNISSETVKINYKNLYQIIKDLRHIGNPLIYNQKPKSITKEYWKTINEKYLKNEDGEFQVTIEFLTIIAHK